jgi:hypothetical protein
MLAHVLMRAQWAAALAAQASWAAVSPALVVFPLQ